MVSSGDSCSTIKKMLYLNICCAKGSRYFTSPHSSADLDAKHSAFVTFLGTQ